MIEWEIRPYHKLEEDVRRLLEASGCLYQHPDFLNQVAPGKAWLACLRSENQTWYFPFTGDKWLWKWRIFRVSFCPSFRPFGEKNIPAFIWDAWFSFLRNGTWKQDWCFQAQSQEVADLPEPWRTNIYPKTNQVLDLSPGFEKVFEGWKPNRKTAWKKRGDIQVIKLSPSDFRPILKQLKEATSGGWFPNAREVRVLGELLQLNSQAFQVELWAANIGQQPGSLVLLAHFRNRIHYLFSVSTKQGFKSETLTALLGTVFCQNSGIFDFEGSSIPGVKAFFNSFGAAEAPFYGIKKGA